MLMLVEDMPAFIEGAVYTVGGSKSISHFHLTINKADNGLWCAGYIHYDSGRILLAVNNAENLEEVAIRLRARLDRYVRAHAPKPRTLQDLPASVTVGGTNLTEGIPMSDTAANDQKELTHGQKLVGLNFNPAGDPRVTKLKQLAAEQIDILEELHAEQFPSDGSTKPDYDTNLLQGDAIREVIHAQMSTVKRATWNLGKKAAPAAAGGTEGAAPDPGTNGDGTDAAPQQ